MGILEKAGIGTPEDRRISELESEVARLKCELDELTEELAEAKWLEDHLKSEKKGQDRFIAGMAHLLALSTESEDHDWVLRATSRELGIDLADYDEEDVAQILCETGVSWGAYILETAEELESRRRSREIAASRSMENAVLACAAAGCGARSEKARRKLVEYLDPDEVTRRALRLPLGTDDGATRDSADIEARYQSALASSLNRSLRGLSGLNSCRKPRVVSETGGVKVVEGFSLFDFIPNPFAERGSGVAA